MSMGIGLGAFMDGVQRGMDMRDKYDARREAKRNKEALANIDSDARSQFDADVAAGKAEADKFDQFWMKFALPKRKMALIQQGDIAGAKRLDEWGSSSAAREGGRLFSSALVKAQTGDAAGALDDAIRAGQVQGYIDHGYELSGKEEIKDGTGAVVGFRMKVKGPDGKQIEQDIAVGDIPRAVATFANPDAAWQSQVAARAAKQKRGEEIEDYEARKKVDQRYKSDESAKTYSAAREARMKNDLSFADLPPEDQDAAVRKDLEAADAYARSRNGEPATAVPAAAQQQVMVDEATGERFDPAAQPAGLGQPPAGPAPAAAAPTPSPRPQTRADYKAAMLADAADNIAKGGNPQLIAQQLMNAGIPPEEWPAQLGRAPAQPQQQPVGLAP